ncbi:MAG: hypothetical protein OXI70_05805 [Chloroflexota bacterium]|nr:hypothetical protein [Chloroflexota bacterium]
MLTRLQQGRPEDPQHTQVAVRALINAGYAPHEAGRAYVQYRGRVRAAIASWPTIAIAGFATAAIPAAVLAVLGAAPTGLLLCVLGIGLGIIERWRWRRENVLGEFKIQAADQQYLLHQGLLWLVLLVVLAVQQLAQAGAVIGLGLYVGLPLTLVYRYYFYRTYPTALAMASNATAGAQSRSIIEGEIADGDASAGQSDSAGSGGTMVRRPATSGVSSHLRLRVAIFVGSVALWWVLARWWVWQGAEEGTASLAPFSGDVVVDIVGIVVGSVLGVGSAWFYENFM